MNQVNHEENIAQLRKMINENPDDLEQTLLNTGAPPGMVADLIDKVKKNPELLDEIYHKVGAIKQEHPEALSDLDILKERVQNGEI